MRLRPRRKVPIAQYAVVGLCAAFMAYVHRTEHRDAHQASSRAEARYSSPSKPADAPPPGGPLPWDLRSSDGCEEIAGDIFLSLNDQSRLHRSHRVVPEIRDGRARGFRLYSLRPDDPWWRLGLRNGDVLISINEMEITSPIEALEVYQRLKFATELVVRFERQGLSLVRCVRPR